ncbi:MAG: hypothetical protein ACOXZV_07885 [Bacteroidales bacterium]
MSENRNILYRKVKGKSILNSYLEELNLIVRVKLSEKDLIPLEETEHLISRRKQISKSIPQKKVKLKFEDKARLYGYLNALESVRNGKIILFTEYSKYCGALLLNSFNDINYDFSFDDEHSGIVSILSENLNDKLLLDFYEEDGSFFIEVETQGHLWNCIFDHKIKD